MVASISAALGVCGAVVVMAFPFLAHASPSVAPRSLAACLPADGGPWLSRMWFAGGPPALLVVFWAPTTFRVYGIGCCNFRGGGRGVLRPAGRLGPGGGGGGAERKEGGRKE